MLEAKKWYNDLRVENTLKALKKNGFEAIYAPTPEEAVSKIMGVIPDGAVVGVAGSVTLREIGLVKALEERDLELANNWDARRRGVDLDETMRIRRLQLNSDIFLSSANAITETGEIINIDSTGQRVASIIFGPKKVIVVAGVNKITQDLEEGLDRVVNVASPMNAKRLKRKTPCTVAGECSDCDSPDRICNITTVIHKRPKATDLTVILVGKELGY